MRSTDSTTCLDGQILNLQSYAPTEQRTHTATRQHTHTHHQASPAAVRARWPSRWMPRKLELQPVEMAGGLPDRREEEEHWAVLPLSSAAWSIFSLGVPSSRVTLFFFSCGKEWKGKEETILLNTEHQGFKFGEGPHQCYREGYDILRQFLARMSWPPKQRHSG